MQIPAIGSQQDELIHSAAHGTIRRSGLEESRREGASKELTAKAVSESEGASPASASYGYWEPAVLLREEFESCPHRENLGLCLAHRNSVASSAHQILKEDCKSVLAHPLRPQDSLGTRTPAVASILDPYPGSGSAHALLYAN